MSNVSDTSARALLVRGGVAIVFALLLLFAPGLTLATGVFSFVVLFSAYALIEGIASIFSAVSKRVGHWVLMLIFGIVAVLVGLWALRHPLAAATVTITIMVTLLAVKSIIGGIVEIVAAWKQRDDIDFEWLLGINGFVSLLFGLLLITRPVATLEMLILFTAFFLLISGAMQVGLSFQMRALADQSGAPQGKTTA